MQTRAAGFTLVEVLIALAITAFVGMVAYASLANVMASVDTMRDNADRTYEINRAWMILSRDLRQFVQRPVRDEFGQTEPAMTGGEAARFLLSFTRTGWHNPNAHPRSNMQRVNYRVEDGALWRDVYFVLDRSGNTEPRSARLLDGVEYVELAFLDSPERVRARAGSTEVETRDWPDNWVTDTSDPNAQLPVPAAVEIRLRLRDQGEMRRLYALPPL